MSLPTDQLALISTETTTSFQTIPVPSPGSNEVLIKNIAVASNPKDWKVPRDIPGYSCVEGNDLAGIVVKVGEDVTEFKEGDRVASFSKMATQDPKVRKLIIVYYCFLSDSSNLILLVWCLCGIHSLTGIYNIPSRA